MKKKHSLIVGLGLAGMAYAEQLRQNNLSFQIIDDNANQSSSRVAAGVYNTVILKRFSITWNGLEFYSYAMPFYEKLERTLSASFLKPNSIKKIFTSSFDQNQWLSASDRPHLKKLLEPEIHPNENASVKSPFGISYMKETGRVDTKTLLDTFISSLDATQLSFSDFDYQKLIVSKNHIQYGELEASHIVFCEGYRMIENPFFNYLPLEGSKGEFLIIKAPNLKSHEILKGPIFITPLENDMYWAGATFDWRDKNPSPTKENKNWLEKKVKQMISCKFEIVKHIAQIRPTVIDRRPLLGSHPIYPNIHIINGLGTKGVLNAPLLSHWLLNYIEKGTPLNSEANINRFQSSFKQSIVQH